VHESVILARHSSPIRSSSPSWRRRTRRDAPRWIVRLTLNGIKDFENLACEAAANGDGITDERE